jgi:hypothetical protein
MEWFECLSVEKKRKKKKEKKGQPTSSPNPAQQLPPFFPSRALFPSLLGPIQPEPSSLPSSSPRGPSRPISFFFPARARTCSSLPPLSLTDRRAPRVSVPFSFSPSSPAQPPSPRSPASSPPRARASMGPPPPYKEPPQPLLNPNPKPVAATDAQAPRPPCSAARRPCSPAGTPLRCNPAPTGPRGSSALVQGRSPSPYSRRHALALAGIGPRAAAAGEPPPRNCRPPGHLRPH